MSGNPLSSRDSEKPLRRAKYLLGDPQDTRGAVTGALVLLVVVGAVTAPVTLAVALLCVALTELVRVRRSFGLWVCAVGVAVVAGVGGPGRAAADYAAGARTLWDAVREFAQHRDEGVGRLLDQATAGLWPDWFTGQFPLALLVGGLVGYWIAFVRWLHTDEWMVKPPRKGVWMSLRQVRVERRIAAGKLVSTARGAVIGVNRADGSLLELFDEERRGHILCIGANGSGKALDVDTPVPTPGGLVPMGRLGDGDVVFDETGARCSIVQAHPVMHGRDCYAVRFSDGAVLVADGGHLWVTCPGSGGAPVAGWDHAVPHTTVEIRDALSGGEDRNGERVSNLAVRDRVTGGERVRHILAVLPVPSRPVRCLTVDSPSRLYLAGETGIPTHNTTTARKVFEADCDRGQPVFYTDLKGERADREEIVAAAGHFDRPIVTFSLDGGSWWDPFRAGTLDERRDMLVSGHSWIGSPDYYKDAATLYVQVVLAVLDATAHLPYDSTLEQVIALSDLARLAQRAAQIPAQHPERAEVHGQIYRLGTYVRRDPDVLNGFVTKLEILANTAAGRWMRRPVQPQSVEEHAGLTYLDGYPVMDLAAVRRSGAVALFSFSKARDKDNTARLGRVAVQSQIATFGQMSEIGERVRTLTVVDEFSALESGLTTELMVRGRSAGADVLLITQTIEDLEIAAQEKAAIGQMLSNVNVLLAHRVGDPDAAARVAGVAGTRRWVKKRMGSKVSQGVVTVRRGGTTGDDLVDEDNEYPIVLPRTLQDLVPGRFVLISRSQGHGKRVIQQASRVINGVLHVVQGGGGAAGSGPAAQGSGGAWDELTAEWDGGGAVAGSVPGIAAVPSGPVVGSAGPVVNAPAGAGAGAGGAVGGALPAAGPSAGWELPAGGAARVPQASEEDDEDLPPDIPWPVRRGPQDGAGPRAGTDSGPGTAADSGSGAAGAGSGSGGRGAVPFGKVSAARKAQRSGPKDA
jgi:hypothetical protein